MPVRRARKTARRRNPERRDAFHGEVARIFDTRTMEDGYGISSIGTVYDGALQTFHVTDKPEKLLASLKRRANVVAAYGPKGQHAELGPGLYMSGVPEFWLGRAHGKWSFLDDLTASQVKRLTYAIVDEVDSQHDSGRITRSETSHADRILDAVRAGRHPSALLELANQPYAIQFWRPTFLSPLGIEPGRPPSIVELNVVGRFAELNRSQPPAKLLRAMRAAGLQGAFTRMSMGANAELVLWDSRAVRSARVLPQRH